MANAAEGFDPDRVVRLRVKDQHSADRYQFGSGYLICPDLVLTAGHVLSFVKNAAPEKGSECEVQLRGQRDLWRLGRVVWAGDPNRDVSLVRIDVVDESFGVTKIGRLVETRLHDWRAVGFPIASLDEAGRKEEEVWGKFSPVTLSSAAQLGLTIESRQARALIECRPGWAGLSGAAVFSADALVGVIVKDPSGYEKSLVATRIDSLAGDPDLPRAVLEAIRLAGDEYAEVGVRLTADEVREIVLAAQSRDFVGRLEEIQHLDGFVSAESRGIITVAAPAGMGKSTLLIEWMRRQRDRPGGAFFARHFIARRAANTVGASEILGHILRQLQSYRGVPAATFPTTDRGLANEIYELLREPARLGEALIVLIDGLDEADPGLPAFARKELGKGIYIVLGVRAHAGEEPQVLTSWLEQTALGDLPRMRRDLGPLSQVEIAAWLKRVVPATEAVDVNTVAGELLRVSEGIPLFLVFLIDDLAGRVQRMETMEALIVNNGFPDTFEDFARKELDRLDQIEELPIWGERVRLLFSLLTLTLGPISIADLRAFTPELNLRRLDSRIERWFWIAGKGEERRFSFAHPRLAKVFSAVLGSEADHARALLLDYCRSWSAVDSEYRLSYAPDHLIDEAASCAYASNYFEQACAPLQSLRFHCARLALPTSDQLFARASEQLRSISRKATDVRVRSALRIWAYALAEARPRLTWRALPDRAEAPVLFATLVTDFSGRLGIEGEGSRVVRPLSSLRDEPPPIEAILEGHSHVVLGAMELRDGRLLSWSVDATLRLWSAEGAELRPLEAHGDWVNGAIELKDGRLLSWSHDATLRLWSAEGAELRPLEGHSNRVNGAIELRDRRLLSWSDDETLRLWSTEGAELRTLEGHTGRVKGAIELTDGRLLSWSTADTLRLWSTEGTELRPLEGHSGFVNGAMELRDGRLLSWSDPFGWGLSLSEGATLRLWSAEGTELLRSLEGHNDAVIGAIELRDGRLLSWSEDATLRLWSADGAELRPLEGHSGSVNGVIELKSGRLLSWSEHAILRLWSAEGTELRALEGHSNRVKGSIELRDGRLLSWSLDATLRLWSAEGAELRPLEGHNGWVNGAIELRDGRLLSWSYDATLRLWSAEGAELLRPLEGHSSWLKGMIELKDGRLLSWSIDGTLRLWSTEGTELRPLEGHSGFVNGAMELRDGRLLSWSEDATLRLWSAEGVGLRPLQGHSREVIGAIELRDGRLLSWSYDATLRLWSAEGTELLRPLEGHNDGVNGAIELRDGRLLSWSDDDTLRLWSAEGSELRTLEEHTGRVKDAIELRDGRLLSWSEDATLRLWSAEGAGLRPLQGWKRHRESDPLSASSI